MISIYKLKPKFQQVLNPILVSLHSKNITANQITISSVVLSLIVGGLVWYAPRFHYFFLLIPIGLFVRMALNALDGMMAKKYNQISKRGELLNEVGDVFSDLFIYFSLIKIFTGDYSVILFIALSIANEFVGVMGKLLINERQYDGPMGKSDRAFLIGAISLLLFFGVDLYAYSEWIFGVVNILILVSTCIRFRKIWVKI